MNKNFYPMSVGEKRYIRREFINAYIHKCYATYQFPLLRETMKQVREWEVEYYGGCLPIYSQYGKYL